MLTVITWTVLQSVCMEKSPKGDTPEKNLIQNGGFELPQVTGPWRMIQPGNKQRIPHWNFRRHAKNKHGRVDVIGTFWRGVSKQDKKAKTDQSLDLDYQIIVSQKIKTTPGKTYLLRFAYAHNPDSGHTRSSAIVRIHGSKLLLKKNISHALKSTRKNMLFQVFKKKFVADESETTIEFEDTTNGPMGFVIDDVRVVLVTSR